MNVLVYNTFAYHTENLLIVWSDRTSEEVVPFIDIKSEGLRDILRDILHNIKAVSLIDDKLSVIETEYNAQEYR